MTISVNVKINGKLYAVPKLNPHASAAIVRRNQLEKRVELLEAGGRLT